MRQHPAYAVAVTAAIVVSQVLPAMVSSRSIVDVIVYEGADAGAVRTVVAEAVRLLPHPPVRIAVIDADEARPDVRPTLLRLDAFVLKESAVVYVVRQSRLLNGAIAGSGTHRHALAAVLWHEMAHVAGADERGARRQEEALWRRFLRDERVDSVSGLRYLKSLIERPDDVLMTGR